LMNVSSRHAPPERAWLVAFVPLIVMRSGSAVAWCSKCTSHPMWSRDGHSATSISACGLLRVPPSGRSRNETGRNTGPELRYRALKLAFVTSVTTSRNGRRVGPVPPPLKVVNRAPAARDTTDALQAAQRERARMRTLLNVGPFSGSDVEKAVVHTGPPATVRTRRPDMSNCEKRERNSAGLQRVLSNAMRTGSVAPRACAASRTDRARAFRFCARASRRVCTKPVCTDAGGVTPHAGPS